MRTEQDKYKKEARFRSDQEKEESNRSDRCEPIVLWSLPSRRSKVVAIMEEQKNTRDNNRILCIFAYSPCSLPYGTPDQ